MSQFSAYCLIGAGLLLLPGCPGMTPNVGAGGTGGTGAAATGGSGGGNTGGSGGSLGSGGATSEGRCAPDVISSPSVSVDLGSATPRDLLWSVGYWTWAPSFGEPVDGTESLLEPLRPQLIRIGGYNADANVPDPFDEQELDDAAAYAEATGADLVLQLPLLAMPDGARPTPEDVAGIVEYANLTSGHGVQYVSVGNEPDLYPDQGGLDDPGAPAIELYGPEQYCEEVVPMVDAILEVDPTLMIVGPDLGYKYQAGSPDLDWLTPILEGCGELFDVVAIHRYPFESLMATPEGAKADMSSFRSAIESVRGIMSATGFAATPLAVSEAELAYVASPTGNPDGSILATAAHALWIADFFGVSAELDLWSSDTYVLSGPDEFIPGLIGLPPERPLRPAYHAVALAVTPAGATRYAATSPSDDLRVYASRAREDDGVHVALVHWGTQEAPVTVRLESGTALSDMSLTLPAQSVTSLRVPDTAAPTATTYGQAQIEVLAQPIALEVRCRP